MTGVATVIYLTDHGQTVTSAQQPGNSPGAVGGFDVQAGGENWFCAIDGGIARGTALNGAGVLWYSITGGSAQAACIIVPYFNWSGGQNTSNANPDIVVALTALDGSSRSLLWIEGGATPGATHDITPTGSPLFDSPNCVTVHFGHIAVFGKVSGVYKLLTSNDRGTTWVNRGTIASPGFIRCRRFDNSGAASGTDDGQLYLALSAGTIEYGRNWGVTMTPKPSVIANPTGLETVF